MLEKLFEMNFVKSFSIRLVKVANRVVYYWEKLPRGQNSVEMSGEYCWDIIIQYFFCMSAHLPNKREGRPSDQKTSLFTVKFN